MKKKIINKTSFLVKIVGAIGFEPMTSRTRTVRTTGLCHAPLQDTIIPFPNSFTRQPRWFLFSNDEDFFPSSGMRFSGSFLLSGQ